MTLSKAEKERRKDKKVYDHFDYLLSCLEECYKNDYRYTDFKDVYDCIVEFSKGCYLADGYTWNKRLFRRFSDWLDEHQDIIKQHRDRMLEKKKFY